MRHRRRVDEREEHQGEIERVPKASPAGGRQLERALEARREEDDAEFNLVRRGWCLGDETFRQELLAQMRETIGAEHYGEERAQTAEAMAEQIIAAELKRRRWNEAALRTRPRGIRQRWR